jgi:hypothetical protein
MHCRHRLQVGRPDAAVVPYKSNGAPSALVLVHSGSVEVDRRDFRFELIACNDLASSRVRVLPLRRQRERVAIDDDAVAFGSRCRGAAAVIGTFWF